MRPRPPTGRPRASPAAESRPPRGHLAHRRRTAVPMSRGAVRLCGGGGKPAECFRLLLAEHRAAVDRPHLSRPRRRRLRTCSAHTFSSSTSTSKSTVQPNSSMPSARSAIAATQHNSGDDRGAAHPGSSKKSRYLTRVAVFEFSSIYCSREGWTHSSCSWRRAACHEASVPDSSASASPASKL